jgi:hypothetical protein
MTRLLGEKILSKAQPRKGFLWRPEYILPAIAGVAMLSAVAMMSVSFADQELALIPALICVTFAAVGLYLTCGIPMLDAWYRRSTRYVVTDRRVIIKSRQLPSRCVGLLRLDGTAQPITITVDGSIVFSRAPAVGYILRFWGLVYLLFTDDPRLDCLDNPLRVYRIIRRAQERLRRE